MYRRYLLLLLLVPFIFLLQQPVFADMPMPKVVDFLKGKRAIGDGGNLNLLTDGQVSGGYAATIYKSVYFEFDTPVDIFGIWVDVNFNSSVNHLKVKMYGVDGNILTSFVKEKNTNGYESFYLEDVKKIELINNSTNSWVAINEFNVIAGKNHSNPPDLKGNITVNATYNSVTLDWNKSPSIDLNHYKVYRDGQKIGETKTNSYKDNTVKELSSYKYEVYAVDDYDNVSSPIETTVNTPSPPPPSNVKINSFTLGFDKIDLRFSSTLADEIHVYLDGSKVVSIPGASTSYLIPDLEPSTTYKVWIVAGNKGGKTASSILTITTSVKPPPPSGVVLNVSDVKDKSVRLNFNAIDATAIEIYQNAQKVATVTGTTVLYVSQTEPDTEYDYHIVAVNDYGRTASRIIKVKTQELFTKPSNISLSTESVYVDRINLNFNSKFADSYKLYRNGRLLVTIPGNHLSFSDVQVQSDTEYEYQLFAINELGQTPSEVLKVKTLSPPKNDYPKVSISPGSLSFIDFVDVRIFSDDPDSKIFYSFDKEKWEPYVSSLRIKEPKILYAKSENSLGNVSPIETAHYMLSETPKVLLGISLQDVADSQRSHFNVLWPIIAFTCGIILCFFIGRAILRLMKE